jgi:thioredoxin-dependent peroxiredoxin
MKRNSDLVTFGGKPVTLMGRMVEPGHMAKNFAAINSDLNTFNLSEHQGTVRIISAVPSVDTPVCAQQTRRFNEEAAKLSNVKVITISNDLPFALKRFCAAEGIDNLITVSDQKDRDFGIKYGLYIEQLGILARAIIVVDKDNEVKYFELVREIAEEPDYDKALEAVKDLL